MPNTDDRLHALEIEQAKDEAWRTQVMSLLTRIDEAINGNGQPGLKRRVDRLETVASILKWFAITSGAAIILLVLRSVFSHFGAA